MSTFFAFFKKEWLESLRSGKLLFIGILFLAVGIMNPAIAKLTPWFLEMLSEELAESGMTVTTVTVDAMTSWTQFFKNIPLALIAFLFLFGGIFTKEYETGTLLLVLTKGLARYKILIAKAAVLLSVYTLGYALCFGITYGYNAYFWDNGTVAGIFPAVFAFWLFGILIITLSVFFSVVAHSYGGVLLGVGGTVIFFYLLDFIPKISKISPIGLIDSLPLLSGVKTLNDLLPCILVAVFLSAACLCVSILIFHKKQL